MVKSTILTAAAIVLGANVGMATDVINQDQRAYKVTVKGVGTGSVDTYAVKARSSLYGLCGRESCVFSIPGSSITAGKKDKLKINGGKITKF